MRPAPDAIPRFRLYGEREGADAPEFLHIETIRARSARLDWTIRPHRHASLVQLLLVQGGRGTLTLDEEALPFAAPWLVALPPTVVHGFDFAPGTEGHVLTLSEDFFFAACAPNAGLSAVLGQPLLLDLSRVAADERGEIDRIFARIADEFATARPRQSDALAAWVKLLVVLLERVRADGAVRAEAPGKRSYLRFRRLVEDQWREQREIAAYAARLGMSTARLNAACRRASGLTASQILHQRVLLEAKRNLIYTAMTVSEIAYDLDFSEPSYFSRMFRKATGQTPMQFRAARLP